MTCSDSVGTNDKVMPNWRFMAEGDPAGFKVDGLGDMVHFDCNWFSFPVDDSGGFMEHSVHINPVEVIVVLGRRRSEI
jgi:hypothetical protein